MSDQAPRDLSGDLPSVDQYLSGLTLSDDDSVDPSDSNSLDLPPIPDILHTSTTPPGTAFEDEIVDSYPTMEQLQKRIDTNISILLQRYENIMALAASQPNTLAEVAVEGFQLDADANAIIGAAEDLLCVTRIMKEMWLFGKMDTVGENERDIELREKMEADIRAVWDAITEDAMLKIDKMNFGEPSGEPSEQPSEKSSEKPALESPQETEKPVVESAQKPSQEPSAKE